MMTKQERAAQYAECEQFLAELARGLPEDERLMVGYAEEATLQRDENGRVMHAGWWPTPHKIGKGIDTFKNAYICISASIKTPHPKSGVMRYWRGESSFGHGLCLMVDDIGTGTGSKGGLTLEDMNKRLPPSAVVETSPGNFQLFYFLDKPEDDMHKFKSFLQAFVLNVLAGAGGDSTIKDVSRFGRMPIGVNNKRHADGSFKYADENGKPHNVRLHSKDYTNRYSIESICLAFGFTFIVPVKRAPIEANPDEYRADFVWYRMAQDILSRNEQGENGEVRENGSGKIRIMCPWGHEHTNGDPSGAYFRAAIPGAEVEFVFGCAHDTCRKVNKRTWAAFTDLIVMPKIESDLAEINRRAAMR